ncbi:LuxR C-terminal-related transcriptional regulator [Nonomuraea sp. NBC_01738]|uniref:helix-turn-helix transcriptional regulator n=1 Tax=Nonomuraea sp. NBC_01738 TaxID=2976003 RepID=UPI002E159021|nr:LuxR C-terminal-related transcriptional regulator [Nonomuraea sp. NBC_01738]
MPLVGREHELRRLAETLARPPAVVMIDGEAGVGKTRLLRELPGPLLVGNCHPMRFPFGPIVEALRHATLPPSLNPITGALRPLLPEFAHLLPLAPPPVQDPQVERHRLFRAVLSLLESLQPVTLVVEDIHWIDADTRDLLGFLSRCLPPRAALLLTYRPEDLGGPVAALRSHLPPHIAYAQFSLPPLDRAETALLAKHLLPDPPDLWPLTVGVPFAIEELARMLAEGHPPGTPPALRDAVLLKLEALPVAARRVVQAAAVLEEPSCERSLAAAAGVPAEQCERGLAEAIRRGLLRETTPGQYGLRHPLAKQAVYDSITPGLRRRLHRRIEAPSEPRGAVSPREEQVIRLAAQGLTNREIAESLFLSPRTVEVHVANALRKLGLTSRRQLPRSTT